MQKIRQFILGFILLTFTSLAHASEGRSNERPQGHRAVRIVLATVTATMVLAVIGITPSVLVDLSSGLLSSNPFTHLRVELRTLTWALFGPGYWLWESSLNLLTQGAESLTQAGLGGEIMQPGYLDQISGLQSALQSAYNIVELGPTSADFLANYFPWMAYASLTGTLYGIIFAGADSVAVVFRQRRRLPSLPSTEPQVGPSVGCTLF